MVFQKKTNYNDTSPALSHELHFPLFQQSTTDPFVFSNILNCNKIRPRSGSVYGDLKIVAAAEHSLDLLQVSLLINKQNEIGQDLDGRLSFMLAEEPIKLEQVNLSLVFGTRSPQVSFSSPFPFRFLLLLPSRLFIDQERDLEQVQAQ